MVKVLPDDPLFYPKAFSLIAEGRKKGSILEEAVFEEYDLLSRKVDETKFQESCAVRNVLRTRELAKLLIDDNGVLNAPLLKQTVELLKNSLYSLGPGRQFDAERQLQILRALTMLQEDPRLKKILTSVTKPHQHKYADQIIRNTLDMPPHSELKDAHARRAFLSAWMCYLRQNVGSCFATAPAIMVHNEQPHQFLQDVNDLLATGRMKRTFGGNEYSVPLSASWGKGDLRKPVLIERRGEEVDPPLWESPGLVRALEAVGIKMEKELVLQALPSDQPLFLTDAETVIKSIVLNSLKLSVAELKEHENRPKKVGGLRGPAPPEPSAGKFTVFYEKFEAACNAFKALAENALLKAWEFSIASFAETKAEFTSWNLYSSLGLKPEEQGGIGYCIYRILQEKLNLFNAKVQELQQEYELMYTQVKFLEGRMSRAASEDELKWLKIEYQTRTNEFYNVQEMRDDAHQKAQKIAGLYQVLMDRYFELFPRYFQEVYDADMQDVQVGPYDDSPAGFRLLYKHGRTNTSLWTMIRDADEYVEALASFFITTETEITSYPEMEGLKDEFGLIITDIVNHVRTKEFLETAFYRMAIAHNTPPIKDPLDHLDQITKKPWVYTSGGAMSSLVSTYFKLEGKPEDVDRWVENPMELLVFLVDSIKRIPQKISQPFFQSAKNSILMHSPIHAFLLKPKFEPFLDACLTEEFTYTWIRDKCIGPMQKFVYQIALDEEMMEYLLDRLKKKAPEMLYPYFSRRYMHDMYGTMSPKEFRRSLLDHFRNDQELKQFRYSLLPREEIDSTLYSLLPLFRSSDLKHRLTDILGEFGKFDAEIEEICEEFGSSRLMDAAMLRSLCLAQICLKSGVTSAPADYHFQVAQAARKHGYALPLPVVFADTNWVKEYFAFVFSPMTEELELWRTDYTGIEGAPMHSWVQWLNGSQKSPTWGIYPNLYQYTA